MGITSVKVTVSSLAGWLVSSSLVRTRRRNLLYEELERRLPRGLRLDGQGYRGAGVVPALSPSLLKNLGPQANVFS